MKLLRAEPGQSLHPYGAMVGAALLVVGFSAGAWLRLGLPIPVCTLKHWTGLPCLTCGSTRLAHALLRGDLLEAAAWNPLVFAVLSLIAAWAAMSTIRAVLGLPSWRMVLAAGERRTAGVAAAGLVAAGWVYLVLHGV